MRQVLLLAALCTASLASAQAPLDPSQPDFSGIWRLVGYHAATALDGQRAPPLLPEAAKVYAERKAALAKGDHSADPASTCLPEGMPRLMLKAEPFEILQRPTLLAFNYQINRLPRVVYLNQPPSTDDSGYYLGESTATWQGDTLVVDTRDFNDLTWLDDSGLPHGTALKLTERLQLAPGAKQLVDRITIEDPENYKAPWTITRRYERLPGYRMPEDVCAEKIGSSAPRRRQ